MPGLRYRATDKRESTKERAAFSRVRKAERQYGVQLRKVARHVGDIIKAHDPATSDGMAEIRTILGKYSEVIEPWAKSAAARMIADVGRRDEKAWEENSKAMGRSLRQEIANAPTGQYLRAKLAENVKLIKSLPTEAAERVHKLTLEAITSAGRAGEIATEIARSGDVTIGRANTIARTEVARTASGLTEARAKHIGSTSYVWRTSLDSDVRPSHRKMEGKVVEWDNPRTLDGMTGHAGSFPNCRCYCEPIVPEFVD